MKALVKIVMAAALACCLSGCGSSILLKDKKPAAQTAAAKETAAAAGKKTREELEAEYYQDEEKAEIEKYRTLPGTRAFYLLPAGVPWPGGIVSFQLLDVLNGNTTVYAYQTLYALKDESGLGGQHDAGKKQTEETVGQHMMPFIPEFARQSIHSPTKIKGPADKADKLATLIMAYNFETKEYRVLFHDLQDVSVSYIFDGEAVKLEIRNLISESSCGKLDLSPLRAVRVAEGKYAFCYRDHLYRIGSDGAVESDISLAQDLRFLMQTQRKKSSDLWHVQELAADADGNSSLLVQCVNDETPDEDARDSQEQEENTLRQFLLSSDRDDGEQIFQTDNLSYAQQADAYLRYDGKTIDLGTLPADPDEEDILKVIGSKDTILAQFPDKFNPYYRKDGSRLYRLYAEGTAGNRIYPDGGTVLDPASLWHVSVEESIGSAKACSDAYIGSLSAAIPAEDKINRCMRKVEVKYQTEHEEYITDSEGNIRVIIVTEEHRMTYHDTAEFREGRTAKLPGKGISWYWNVPYSGGITSAPYRGVTGWNSEDPDPDNENSTGQSDIRWDVYGSPFLKVGEEKTEKSGISFPHPLKLVDMQREAFDGFGNRIPVLYLSGPDAVSVYYNFNQTPGAKDRQWAESLRIPKERLSYTKRTDDQGKLSLDYSKNALHLTKENGRPVLYAASMAEGLTRLPLRKDGSASGLSDQGLRSLLGRITDFPCLKIFMPEKKDMLYVFGFDGADRGFTESDFPFCSIYKVNPFSEKYCGNLIASVLNHPDNFEYKWKLLNLSSDQGAAGEWNRLYDALGIGALADKAVLEKIRTQILIRWSNVMRFIRLAKLENVREKGSMVQAIESSRTVAELENVIITYSTLTVPEEKIPKPTGNPPDPFEVGVWEKNIRLAKLQAVRDLQKPKMTDKAWNEELDKILVGMGNKTAQKEEKEK